MAKAASKKKASSTGSNPDRKNGKAWKKNKPVQGPKLRTPERQLKDDIIRARRIAAREDREIKRAEAEKIQMLKDAEAAEELVRLEQLPDSVKWVAKKKLVNA